MFVSIIFCKESINSEVIFMFMIPLRFIKKSYLYINFLFQKKREKRGKLMSKFPLLSLIDGQLDSFSEFNVFDF